MSEPVHSDIDLLRRYAAERDAEAFAAITRRYAGMVYAVARRVTGSAHDAEDIAQACFLELARRAGDVRSSLAGWLHALVVSRSRNFRRDGATRARHEREAGAGSPAAAEPSSRPDQMEWGELSPLIDEAIDALPDELRVPLLLHYLHDRGQGEIAAELGTSQATISRRIREGVDRLRSQLKRAGLSASAAGIAEVLPRASARGEVVPEALRASLGKLAIAGIGPAPAGVAAGTWIALALALLAAGGTAGYLLFGRPVAIAVNPAAKMVQDGGRAYIEQVPPLVWGAGNSGQRSMLGALSAATQATDRPIDYTTLIGDSGVAFTVRWHPIGGREFNAYQAVNVLDAETLAAVQQAAGFRLRLLGEFGRRRTPVSGFADELARRAAAGWPVIVEERADRDFAVVVGVAHMNQRLLLREYGSPGELIVAKPEELGGGAVVLEAPLEKPSRRDAVIRALRTAVADWDRTQPTREGVLYGNSAFDQWQRDVADLEGFAEPQLWVLWRESWWTFDILCDGHFHAARYLRAQAGLFSAQVQAELLAAADEYASLEAQGLVDSVFLKSDGPWTNRTIEDFLRTRPEQAALIAAVKQVDRQAIGHLRRAVELIK